VAYLKLLELLKISTPSPLQKVWYVSFLFEGNFSFTLKSSLSSSLDEKHQGLSQKFFEGMLGIFLKNPQQIEENFH